MPLKPLQARTFWLLHKEYGFISPESLFTYGIEGFIKDALSVNQVMPYCLK
jgi:hypothetical protein